MFVVCLQDGSIRYAGSYEDSVAARDDWWSGLTDEQRHEHSLAGTQGGVNRTRMLLADWKRLGAEMYNPPDDRRGRS